MIVFYASSHGWGHNVRLIAIANELFEQKIEFVTTAPEWFIKTSLIKRRKGKVTFHHLLTDPGCIQSSPFEIDFSETKKAWENQIQKFQEIVDSEVQRLKNKRVKMIISDISFIGQLVGEKLRVPTVCIANFDWNYILGSNIFKPENHSLNNALHLVSDISSKFDFCLIPGTVCRPLKIGKRQIEFNWLSRKPRVSKFDIRKMLGLNLFQDSVLLSFGGHSLKKIDAKIFRFLSEIEFFLMLPESEISDLVHEYNLQMPQHSSPFLEPNITKAQKIIRFFSDIIHGTKRLPIITLKSIPNLHFLSSEQWSGYHVDIVNGVDIVFGKLGYGLCSEAIHCKTKLLCVSRPGNPETSILLKDTSKYISVHIITSEQFKAGDWFQLNSLLDEVPQNYGPKNTVEVNGEKQIATWIRKQLNEDENPIEPKDPKTYVKKLFWSLLLIFIIYFLISYKFCSGSHQLSKDL